MDESTPALSMFRARQISSQAIPSEWLDSRCRTSSSAPCPAGGALLRSSPGRDPTRSRTPDTGIEGTGSCPSMIITSASVSRSGRGITWAATSSPARAAAFLPASTAAWHEPRSPLADNRDEPGPDALAGDQPDIRRLRHCVSRFDGSNQPAGFNESV